MLKMHQCTGEGFGTIMNNIYQNYLKDNFGIDETIIKMAQSAENEIGEVFKEIEAVREINQYKVIAAMQDII